MNDYLNKKTIKVWHGGKRFYDAPEIRKHNKGSAECGTGIYTTTRYEVAKKYSKGGGKVLLMELKPNITWLEKTNLNLSLIQQFVSQCNRLPNKTNILNHIIDVSERLNTDQIPAQCLVNLWVNYDASHGERGITLTNWLVDQGIDASLHRAMSQDDWVIIFNPKIIQKVHREGPFLRENAWNDFDRIEDQIKSIDQMNQNKEIPEYLSDNNLSDDNDECDQLDQDPIDYLTFN